MNFSVFMSINWVLGEILFIKNLFFLEYVINNGNLLNSPVFTPSL